MEVERLELWEPTDDWEVIATQDPRLPLHNYQRVVQDAYRELTARYPPPTTITVRGLRTIVVIEAAWGTGPEALKETHKITIVRPGTQRRRPTYS